MDTLPIPRDFPLPMPASEIDLQVLIVILFLAHLLFVNLMVGGALLTVAFEIRGLRRPPYDALAKKIAATVTVNKSIAVVLGGIIYSLFRDVHAHGTPTRLNKLFQVVGGFSCTTA